MSHFRMKVLALALSLFLATFAVATSVIPMSVEQLTTAADTVVRARAGESWSSWQGRQIFTYTRFQLINAMKGLPPQTMVVKQMGGSAAGYTQHVAGIRHWRSGEEAVLFLRSSVAGDGTQVVVGLMQGNFVLHATPRGVMASNGVPEVTAVDGESHQFSTYNGSSMPLQKLEERIQKVVGR